jgi:hypothetical protein
MCDLYMTSHVIRFPLFRFPTHPFRAPGALALGRNGGVFPICKYHEQTAAWCAPKGVFSGSQPNFLDLGAS